MGKISQVVLCAVLASGFAGPSYAACSLAGKWHSLMIAAGTNNQNGSGSVVAGCRLTIKANGTFSGTCIDQGLGQAASSSTTVSGAENQCEVRDERRLESADVSGCTCPRRFCQR
jgi:hypothetical protein